MSSQTQTQNLTQDVALPEKYAAFFRNTKAKFYRLSKKRQGGGNNDTQTTAASEDTFYTAIESVREDHGQVTRAEPLSVREMEAARRSTDVAVDPEIAEIEEKLQADSPILRTPLMMALMLANEILAFCAMFLLVRWLLNYRGGMEIMESFWPMTQREPKHSVNVHAFAMAFCFAFCMQQVAVTNVFFEKFSKKTRINVEMVLRLTGFIFFILGMSQIRSAKEIHLPHSFDGPDIGIHLIHSIAAIIVYLVSSLNFVLNAVTYYYGGVRSTIIVGYLINLFLNNHVVETLGHLLDFIAFLSLLTGFFSYIILLFSASNYDLKHVFNDPIDADHGKTEDSEQNAYVWVIVVLTCMYLTTVCILFYQHNILYHRGIITYQMYKNNFKDIADALSRAKNKKEALQEMTDIECLCQYEKPATNRASKGGLAALEDGMNLKKRPTLIKSKAKIMNMKPKQKS